MRRCRWAAVWLMTLCFVIFGTTAAMAQGSASGESASRVYDMADLLDDAAEAELETEIEQAKEKLGFDIVIVTADDAEGKGAQEYADLFYEDGAFGSGSDRSGILFLIDMDNRELVLSTDGKAIRIFTDDRIDAILDDVYEGASESDFEASAWAFLQDVIDYGEEGIVSGQYNYDSETGRVDAYKSIRWYEFLIALVVSALVAGGACLSVKKQYEMEPDDRQKSNLNMAYRASSQFAYQDPKDLMVNQFVTTKVIPKKSSSSSSGSSHRSGGSSGRSTTHRSSSGRSHGGGSRKF